ncbi:MarR family winged helix-turn-helix transcriptional regulator [Nocardia concava]|uniref:MarR family winged helix-turn-helix transcriptional regulator n=1 Tax=Nocardia concava TaxID=257281 RepID=UPI00031D929D|nr:MarR family transcriptional regulator [Nocardia concava]
MNEVKKPTELPKTVAFRLGTVGSVVADRFAARIAGLDLKPKHAGLMTALSHGEAASQQELAKRLGVAPSLVVSLADHLERLGAIERVRDPEDRRRQVLTLTEPGYELLAACEQAAKELDKELTAGLTAKERTAFLRALGVLAAEAGLPTGE